MEISDIVGFILSLVKYLVIGATLLLSLVIMVTLLKPQPKQTPKKNEGQES
jgi:hypothetical protein